MNNNFSENSNVPDRTFNMGMIATGFFIFINILMAFTSPDKSQENYSQGFAETLRVAIYFFLYATIWYVMREVLVKVLGQIHMLGVTTWLLRLVILSGLFTLAIDTFKQQSILVLFFMVGLAMLGVFINFLIRVMQLDVTEQPVLRHLRSFVIAFIIMFVFIMMSELITLQFNINMKMIGDLLYGVPFVFVYLFFKEAKEKNADTN